MSSKRPTTTDIARLAGVSQSTVSMILSGKTNVSFSPETIDRVCAAAEQLGYQAKKRGASDMAPPLIAVVAPTPGNPYYSTIIQSLENEASSKGYQLFICNTYYDAATENRYLDLFSTYSFRGIIFTYNPYNRERTKALSLTIPTVTIAEKTDSIDMDTVSLNSVTAGNLLASHLWELGHRKIAFITTQLNNNLLRSRRLDGMRQFFEEQGADLIVEEANINLHTRKYSLNIEYKVGYELTSKLCADRSITAYVGVNDMVAYGVIDALQDNGLLIPDDCSVCGFDNIFASRFHNINLTTIDSFLIEKGRDAFELLTRKIQNYTGADSSSIFQIEYKPQVIARKSTGPAKEM